MERNFSKTTEISGKECLTQYINLLYEKSSDFKNIRAVFEDACRELSKDSAHTDELIEHTNGMLAVSLEFSYRLGLEHNLSHFKDPKAPTFLENDYNVAMDEKGITPKSRLYQIIKFTANGYGPITAGKCRTSG